jgi:hypothetical protein
LHLDELASITPFRHEQRDHRKASCPQWELHLGHVQEDSRTLPHRTTFPAQVERSLYLISSGEFHWPSLHILLEKVVTINSQRYFSTDVHVLYTILHNMAIINTINAPIF